LSDEGNSSRAPRRFRNDANSVADGTTKPIKDVTTSDTVTATDPHTGTTRAERVTRLHVHRDTDLTDVSLAAAGAALSTVQTTQHHPFWDATAGMWVEAKDLTVGHALIGPDGSLRYIAAVHNYTGGREMRDLTVDEIHTYYVLVGDTPVLVHNCGGDIYDHGGSTIYRARDELKRPTSVSSSITRETLDTGTEASRRILPPGWRGNGTLYNEARAHLLAKMLGGTGKSRNNLVTMTQDPANSPVMRDFETEVYNAVAAGEAVQYTTTAIYNGEGLVPIGIQIEAYGSRGFCLEICIVNPAGQPGYGGHP
jgi:hypothetical protein